MRILYAFMRCGESSLVAVADDGQGKHRRVNLKWESRDESHLPPTSWAESVKGEINYQRSVEASPSILGKLR